MHLLLNEAQLDYINDGNNITQFASSSLSIIDVKTSQGGYNMINSVSVAPQTVLTNANILYLSDRVRSNRCDRCNGGWLFHDLGSGQFLLNNNTCKCAIFEVQANMNITSATAGPLAFVITRNGEAIGGTEMDYTVVTANTYQSVSASTLISVPAGADITISVRNISVVSALAKDSNIIIKKIA